MEEKHLRQLEELSKSIEKDIEHKRKTIVNYKKDIINLQKDLRKLRYLVGGNNGTFNGTNSSNV
jgi:predicted  nucleic acid-binding Zn-ribbon protein